MLRVSNTGIVRMPETDWEALDRRHATAAYAAHNGSSVDRRIECKMDHATLDILHPVEKLSQTGKAYFCAYSSTHDVVLLDFALNPNAAMGVGELRDTFDLTKAEVEDALGGDVMFMAFRPEGARDAVFILPTQDDALQASGVPKMQIQLLQSLFHLANLTLDNINFRRQSSQ